MLGARCSASLGSPVVMLTGFAGSPELKLLGRRDRSVRGHLPVRSPRPVRVRRCCDKRLLPSPEAPRAAAVRLRAQLALPPLPLSALQPPPHGDRL